MERSDGICDEIFVHFTVELNHFVITFCCLLRYFKKNNDSDAVPICNSLILYEILIRNRTILFVSIEWRLLF